MTARLKSVLGYGMAAMSILIMLAVLPSVMFLAEPLITATGLTVTPRYTGGEVVATIDHGTYQTRVHRLVFDALIGERKNGFIQVDWVPVGGLPVHIDEEIDANGDGQADFGIAVDTAKKVSTLKPHAPWVLQVEGSYRLKHAFMVRVRLRNPSKPGTSLTRR